MMWRMEIGIAGLLIALSGIGCTVVVKADTNKGDGTDSGTQDSLVSDSSVTVDSFNGIDTGGVQDTGGQADTSAVADTSLSIDTSDPSDGLADANPQDTGSTDVVALDAQPVDAIAVDTAPGSVWYELQTNQVNLADDTVGTMIVSHNALAMFPMNFTQLTQIVSKPAPETVHEIQTNSACVGNAAILDFFGDNVSETSEGHVALLEPHPLLTNINAATPSLGGAIGHVSAIEVYMPYYVPQDQFKRVPGPMCYGYHKAGLGWVVNFDPIDPVLDEDGLKGTALIPVDLEGVDSVFLLFDKTVGVSWIKYQAISN